LDSGLERLIEETPIFAIKNIWFLKMIILTC